MIISSIYRAAPVLNGEALWPDKKGESFYACNGGYSPSIPIVNDTTNALWRFVRNGNSGSWHQVLPPPNSNFSSLARVEVGLYAHGNGFGYSLGGRENVWTDLSLMSENFYPPGLGIYDTSSDSGLKVSSTGYNWSGTASGGVGQFVPLFGQRGLMVFLGVDANDIDTLVRFDNIAMYNLATQHWATQKANGELPSRNEGMCCRRHRGQWHISTRSLEL